jgi:hypothetical protein
MPFETIKMPEIEVVDHICTGSFAKDTTSHKELAAQSLDFYWNYLHHAFDDPQ